MLLSTFHTEPNFPQSSGITSRRKPVLRVRGLSHRLVHVVSHQKLYVFWWGNTRFVKVKKELLEAQEKLLDLGE